MAMIYLILIFYFLITLLLIQFLGANGMTSGLIGSTILWLIYGQFIV
jgi:hypothetical protein